jgi:ABC-type branched-subunit amino acid transport system substrate-binding protein
VRALAAEGAVAIVAPVSDPDVAAAAAARPDPALPIVSPTAAASFSRLPQVYALNVPDTLGAAALGAHAARRGPTPIGVLRSRSATGQAQARAFSAAVVAAGGRVQQDVSYDPGTTTFGTVLRRLRDAQVRTVFVAADERDVRQILPQVRYYGLEAAQVLTTGPWATPDGVMRIGLGTLDGAIITLPFLPADSAGGWQQFQRAYAEHLRRSLDNALPALGYDAAQLALGNLGTRPSAGAVAAALASGAEVRGATGRLRVAGGSVLRRPLLVQVRDGRLIPVTPQER